MAQYVMGVDNGGTVIKAALFRLDGTEAAVASRHTPVSSPRPGYQERDMEEVWQKNCACIRQVLEQSGVSPQEVAALAGLSLLPEDRSPLRQRLARTAVWRAHIR